MIIYDGVKSDFMRSVEDGRIANVIEKNILSRMGRHTTANEFSAFDNSLQRMYTVLNDEGIPSDAGIAIEYNIPQTAKRVDFMISGFDSDEKPSVVIVELKQWQKMEKVEATDAVIELVETYTGHGLRHVVHPSYQAWSYAKLISDYNSAVQDSDVKLAPCAYLHNYIRRDNDPLDDMQYEIYTKAAPPFTKTQTRELRDFIKKWIKKGDNKEVLYIIDHGKIKPSKSLQNSIASMMEGNREFVMIDEQRVVYEQILKLSEQCQRDQQKRTIICKGGPGTGKSVIAVQLLAELTKREQFVQYVSKNQAPRQVYLHKLRGTRKLSGVENLFKGSQNYVNVKNNQIHTLIVDEAHRLEERSQYTKKTGNENQVKEIIHAATCSVFFIDESQRVTMSDIGSVDEIRKWANIEHSEVIEMELLSQFRCNGSDGYLAWVDNILEIRETANYDLDGIDYDIRVLENPNEVRDLINEKNKAANRARILAGYCWNWNKDKKNDTNYHDIKIGDFEMSWNLSEGIYAIGDTSVNEVGCIHTTQGLEFDYVGVIMGDDIRYENGHVVTDFTKRASTDQSIKGLKSMYRNSPDEALKRADEIIKNTYRTLMTRGMKGCYIYCTDPGMNDYLKGRVATLSSESFIKRN
ncbi:MAG: DUF2075 domain-containing protein [Erysipelotrichaceae bacterium]|nr:DUF2075 domain-containing protein [Erysipelotrichaceae bacterium]